MSLSEEFNQALTRRSLEIIDDHSVRLDQDIQLGVWSSDTAHTSTIYDFLQRRVMTLTRYDDKQITTVVTPFKDTDRETLEAMRDYLISKDRKPLPLPEKASPGFSFDKKFGG